MTINQFDHWVNPSTAGCYGFEYAKNNIEYQIFTTDDGETFYAFVNKKSIKGEYEIIQEGTYNSLEEAFNSFQTHFKELKND